MQGANAMILGIDTSNSPLAIALVKDDTVLISVNIGNSHGFGQAWGCDLSYDYVKINAEYTT